MKATTKLGRISKVLCLTNAIGFAFARPSTAQIITEPQPSIFDESRMLLAGTSCDASDSLSQISNREGTVLMLSFNNFIIEGTSRGNCTLRIPLTIPAGHRVIVTEGAPNGFADLYTGDQLAIASRLSLMGVGAPVYNKRLVGPLQEDFGPALDQAGSRSIFQSPRRITSACVTRDQTGFLGLNIAASILSSSRIAAAYISDAQIGVRVVPCQ